MTVLCFVMVCASYASAQSVSIATPDPKRWDVTGSVGWLGGNKSEIAEEWNNWYDAFATSVDVGWYWTPHVKTEAGFTYTGEGDVYSQQQFLLPGRGTIFIPREHHFRLRGFTAAATWQLFENTWVHPFLNAGVQVVEERERTIAQGGVPFFDRNGTPFVLPRPETTQSTSTAVRPFVGGGAKFYVNERGFVRSDLTVAWDDGRVGHVTWRAGIGVDF